MIKSPRNVEKACPATFFGVSIMKWRSTSTFSGHWIKRASALGQ